MTSVKERPTTITTTPTAEQARPYRAHTGELPGQHVARRAIVAVALCSMALLHVMDLPGKLQELPYVGWMFIGLVVASLLTAEALIRTDTRLVWLSSGTLAASAIVGYAISRTVGMPGDLGGDKGNWIEPLGLASLFVEGLIVLLVLGRLVSRPR